MIILLFLWSLFFEHDKNPVLKSVLETNSIVVLAKSGYKPDNYVAVFPQKKMYGFDLAMSNCEQSLSHYQKLYTDGHKFMCIRIYQ